MQTSYAPMKTTKRSKTQKENKPKERKPDYRAERKMKRGE